MIGQIQCGAADFYDLSENLLSQGIRLRFRASGNSMFPSLRHGDILQVEPISSRDLRIGDVILFQNAHGVVLAHRLIGKRRKAGKAVLRTRGDSLARSDASVGSGDVFGRVIAFERAGRTVTLQRGVHALLGRFIARVPIPLLLPLRKLAFLDHRRYRVWRQALDA